MTMATIAPTRHRALSLLFAFIGIPVLSLLGFFWLEIPDSHIWQLAFSSVTGVVIVAAFAWLIASVVRSVRNAQFPGAAWLGALLVAVWMLTKWFAIHVISKLDDKGLERAGYWNSKLGAHMRVTFTSDRLYAWQHDFVLFLLWIVVPALITPFFVETVARGLGSSSWRAAGRVIRRWQHWIAIVICGVTFYWLTSKLIGWKPSHSVHGELISLALRLTLCYTIDYVLIVLLLAVDSKLLAREHAGRYPIAEPSANIL